MDAVELEPFVTPNVAHLQATSSGVKQPRILNEEGMEGETCTTDSNLPKEGRVSEEDIVLNECCNAEFELWDNIPGLKF